MFLWEDDLWQAHRVTQGEGGEQGDPLMPMLFSLGQHAALEAVAHRLREGERDCWFSSTTCTSSPQTQIDQLT